MKTRIISVTREEVQDSQILPAAQGIMDGRIVVFPTETVYGVGCRYNDQAARDKIFALKGRDRSKPLGIYLRSVSEVGKHAMISPMAKKLAGAFLPGPLTLVLPGPKGEKLGFRVSSDEVTRRLIRLSGIPLCGSSANVSGRESPTDGQQAIAAMNGRVDFIVDAGKTELARPSTVIDLCTDPPTVLREGVISLDDLTKVVGCEVRKAF